ncbi:Calx-beta domain-containing protein [Azohydromonas lata]|uniref:Calx-beta domain-containing protein n=1 Tax=Azohydromonas lata TaxID=45677 RepID=A0ABU5IH23_9BURK|nr:Calx-beta domain-containing protein [Azohydromonas lata]MDZ5458440.1 Calx-beta domain-containing protein [Azohydromonas lata]
MTILIDDLDVDESDGLARFTVKLSEAHAAPVSVRWATADVTALAGVLTFDPGQLVLTVDVPLLDNFAREPDEIFKLLLSNPVNDVLASTVAWATLHDDDGPRGRPVIHADDTVVDDATGAALFTFTLDRPSATSVSVRLALDPGSTAQGDLLPFAPRTLVFAPGEVVKTVRVDVAPQDDAWHGSTHFDLRLSSPVGADVPDANARAFIAGPSSVRNDGVGLPLVSVSDAFAGEGDGEMRFLVSLSARSDVATSVSYFLRGFTAQAGADFHEQSGTLVFAPGEISRVITVPVLNDSFQESEEVFTVFLGNAKGLVIVDGVGDAQGTIRDDDRPTGTPTVFVDDGVVDGWEPFARFHVWLDRPSTEQVTVRYATSDGSARAGTGAPVGGYNDYVDQGVQTLVFAPGEVSKTVLVPLAHQGEPTHQPGSELREPAEFFDLRLTNAANAGLGDGLGHMVISGNQTNLGASSTLRVVSAATREGGTTLDFFVERDFGSDRVESVGYAAIAGTAEANLDFFAHRGGVTFQPGQTLQVIRIPLINDTVAEGTETITLRLTTEDGRQFDVQGRILDDERPAGGQTLTGAADVDNVLMGPPGTTLVIGGDHDDLLDGSGAVTLRGGLGGDSYIVDTPTTRVEEGVDAGLDTVYAYFDYTLGNNLEVLALGGVAVRGTGNAGSNTLIGNAVANVLSGGDGIDGLYGGDGNDTLYGDAGGDFMYGGNGADVLMGGLGNDVMSAGNLAALPPGPVAADLLDGGDGEDVLSADSGRDTLRGGAGNDNLFGGPDANVLEGGAGTDTLRGGPGGDTLTGGEGRDIFYFNALDYAAAPTADRITDWRSVDDKLIFNGFGIGDRDGRIEGGLERAAPGGFSTAAELVIFTTDIAGALTADSAAQRIGSATSAYAGEQARLFAVDNGGQSGVFLFTNEDNDARVSAGELTLLVLLDGGTTTLADYALSFA